MKKRRGRPRKKTGDKIKSYLSIGLRGEGENEVFMAIAESLGFSSSSSMVRGLLYALTDNHPDAMRVRKRFGFDRPDDEESRTEIRIAREILGLEDEPGQAEPT